MDKITIKDLEIYANSRRKCTWSKVSGNCSITYKHQKSGTD